MKTYTTHQAISLHGGNVKLSKEQASARAHCLGECKRGIYPVLQTIYFKAGETFGYDGALPKALLGLVVDEDEEQQAKAEADNSGTDAAE